MDQHQGLIHDEESQNLRQCTTFVRNGGALYNKICCWKCLTSEYFLFGIPALPIVFAVLILLALIVNYSIAVSLNHVSAFLPYVSWLGSQSPEEYIFDFTMSLAVITVAFIIYFKFKIIADNYRGPHVSAVMIINKASAWLGLLASLLFLLGAAFPAVQEETILKVHSYASICAFALMCIYFIIETVMSFKIRYHLPRVTDCVRITRAVFASLCPICLILCLITGMQSYCPGEEVKVKDDKHWGPNEAGYGLHVTSTACEWALVLLMVAFFLTYISELNNHVTEVKVSCVRNNFEPEEE